ncbi:MAG: serine/threonine protein kinase [Deltaproteobacteria bacterium]|nr:serine/threonine protein kinase [Deltaproteobacteria bacterium]
MSDPSPTTPMGGPIEAGREREASPEGPSIPPGTLWDGRYLVERSLGEGGMGNVLLARDLGRIRGGLVALKVLQPRFREVATPYFMREFAVQRKLRHPHIAAALDLGFDHQDGEEVPYFAMQHVPGEPLSDILQEADPPPLEDVWRWTIETLEALDAIHRAGYLHRDVKPGNVLIDRSAPNPGSTSAPRPAVRLIDFGIAVPLDSEPESFFIGTPEFSAPERIECGPPDVRSDLYSVGLLLYELVEGRPPWEGTDPDALLELRMSAPPPPMTRPECPDGVKRLVAELLAPDPAERPDSAGETIARLRGAIGWVGPIESPEAFAQRLQGFVPTSASYHEALRAAAAPGGAVLVVNVPFGHDGQALLETMADRASLNGVRVVRLRLEGKRGPPMHELEAALDVFRRLRRRDGSALPLRGMAGAATMLTRLHRPTLLCIDGLERADEAILMVLASAFLGAHNANLTVVATIATDGRPKAPAAFAELLTHSFVRHIVLQPLTLEETTQHLAQALGPGVCDEARLAGLHAEARGLPLEIVRVVVQAYRRGVLVRRPDDYGWVGSTGLTGQTPRPTMTGELADRLSLVRTPLPWEAVSAFVEDPAGLQRLVDDGVIVRLDGGWAAVMARDLLSRRYASLAAHRRRALHQRLAAALQSLPSFPGLAALVAEQLAESTRPAAAAPFLVHAARESVDNAGVGRALDLLDRAVDLVHADRGDDPTLWQWKVECFRTLITVAQRAGDDERFDGACELLLQAGVEVAHLPSIELALIARIERAYMIGELERMKGAIDQLLVFQESCGGEPARALAAWGSAVVAAVRGELGAAFDACAEGLSLAAEGDGQVLKVTRRRLLELRASLAVWTGLEAVAPRALEALARSGGDARVLEAIWLRKKGDVGKALELLSADPAATMERAAFEVERAECQLALGRSDAALELARSAIEHGRRERAAAIAFQAESVVAEVMLRTGQKATARARLERLASSPPRSVLPQVVHVVRLRHLHARFEVGDPGEELLEAASELAQDAARAHDLAATAHAVLLAGRVALKARRAVDALSLAQWLGGIMRRRPVGAPPEHVAEWLLANAYYQMKWFKSANVLSRRAMESMRIAGQALAEHRTAWLSAGDNALVGHFETPGPRREA